jgi:uracil-DNA glycosylase
VRQAQANSHKDKGWEKFTDAIIKTINDRAKNVVFICWGGYAQKKGKGIDKKKHCVINGPHPSPLSAHRGYFGSKPFSQANAYLKKSSRAEIDWKSCMKAPKV